MKTTMQNAKWFVAAAAVLGISLLASPAWAGGLGGMARMSGGSNRSFSSMKAGNAMNLSAKNFAVNKFNSPAKNFQTLSAVNGNKNLLSNKTSLQTSANSAIRAGGLKTTQLNNLSANSLKNVKLPTSTIGGIQNAGPFNAGSGLGKIKLPPGGLGPIVSTGPVTGTGGSGLGGIKIPPGGLGPIVGTGPVTGTGGGKGLGGIHLPPGGLGPIVGTGPTTGTGGGKGLGGIKIPPGGLGPIVGTGPIVGGGGAGTGGTGTGGTGTGGSGTGGTGTGGGSGGTGTGTGTGTPGGSGTGTGTGTGTGGGSGGMGSGNCHPGGGCYPGGIGWLPLLSSFGGFGGYGGGYGGGYVGGTTVVSEPVVNVAPVAAVPANTVATPAATVAGVDLQLVDVRLLDRGNPAEQVGPRYRVTFRNAGTAPVDHEFNVALVASDDANVSPNLPITESRVASLPTGQLTYVDMRLPATAFAMGSDAHTEFSKLVVFVDSRGEVNDANRDNNAAGVDRTAVQPAS